MDNEQLDIYYESDLKKLIIEGVISRDIIVRGEQLNRLYNIQKIKGCLGICDSSLESLDDLKEITGDFWISSYSVFSCLNSLGNLEKVGGEVNLRYSNINNLGALKKVGGKFSLRDTKINSLGVLQYVGGDLFLPKRLQGTLDFSSIIVKGKIRYWNDSKNTKVIISKEKLGLTNYQKGVPFWRYQSDFSFSDLENASIEQQEFYKIYKQKFLNGEFLDIEGNNNYLHILFYDLLAEYSKNKNIQELQKHFKNLEKYYPKTQRFTSSTII